METTTLDLQARALECEQIMGSLFLSPLLAPVMEIPVHAHRTLAVIRRSSRP